MKPRDPSGRQCFTYSQADNEDPSNIISLRIIISNVLFISTDAELNIAVSTGESLLTIRMSFPAKLLVRSM